MNTNPKAKVILCFGDSNTHGVQYFGKGRYPSDIRWPGRLQIALGSEYYVIEEGLGGRTTNLPHENPEKPERSGLAYYKPCLESHEPIDAVIIMLGTNDLKTKYGSRTSLQIAEAIEAFVLHTQQATTAWQNSPQIVLISPVYITSGVLNSDEGYYDQTSIDRSKQLASSIADVAERHGCDFIDAQTVAHAGDDGLHMTPESHAELARAVTTLL